MINDETVYAKQKRPATEFSFYGRSLSLITQATPSRRIRQQRSRVLCNIVLVEARGVEPLSESASTGTSPSADDQLHSLTQPWVVTLLDLVES